MSDDRHQRAKALFLAASERAPAQRAAFLDEACAGEPALRADVESLLAHAPNDPPPVAAAATQRDLEAGEVFAERYRIVSLLGRGGMGEVYRADDLRLGVPIALKRVHGAHAPGSERLLSEVRLARNVTHPAVCRVFDIGEHEGELFLTMEYVDGEDLGLLLQRAGRLPSERVLDLAHQLCAGLEAAHDQGILHRDLKPANVLVDRAGRARITDFGIATSLGLDAAGSRVGTPAYMAPEQLAGSRLTEAADLYALGLVLYELATGERPGEAPSLEALRTLRQRAPAPPSQRVPELDRDLEAVILRALQPEPHHRFGSAREMAQALGAPPTGTSPESRADPARTGGERRQVTAVFCDLVGSTELGERLDPEDLHEVTRAYQVCCAEAVDRFDGHVHNYLGDGLLVLFGYPLAHEDDALRATRAALAIQQGLEALNQRLAGSHRLTLAARIGVHTGTVVVGETGEGGAGTQVLGHAMNVAARLQEQAEPGTVVISEATRRLVEDCCETRALGAPMLRGVSEPVAIHQVVRAVERADVATHRYRSPFVGRRQELGLLRDRFEEIQDGHGQVVLVTGDAGLGKTRLLQQFRQELAEAGARWLSCSATPESTHSPFHGASQWLRQALGSHDAPTRDQLETHLEALGGPMGAALPALGSLLSLSSDLAPVDPPPDHDAGGAGLLRSLVDWIQALATQTPLVLACEDLHWTDPSTIEVLSRLIEQSGTTPVLVLATTRPSFALPWRERGNLTQISLRPIARRHTLELVRGVAEDVDLAEETIAKVAERADGNPLYLEELTRLVLEEGEQAAERIPASLQESLSARLDRLGPARSLVQACAVLGREFRYPLLAEVAHRDDAELQRELATLAAAEVLHQRGSPPDASYGFAHALLQEAAYDSLLRRDRRRLHARAADALLRAIEGRETPRETVAHHLFAADRIDEAIDAWWNGAQRAAERSAWGECISQLRCALEAADRLPAEPSHQARELDLRFLLTVALNAAEGFGLDQLVEELARVRTLAAAIGDPERLFEAWWGGFWVFGLRADEARTKAATDAMRSIAGETESADHRMRSHFAEGQTALWSGRHSDALASFASTRSAREQMVGHHDPLIWSLDPSVELEGAEGWCRWYSGEPDRARQCVDAGVALAETLGRPFTLAGALFYQGYLLVECREWEAAEAAAKQLFAIHDAVPMAGWRAAALAIEGSVQLGRRDGQAAQACLEESIALLDAMHTTTFGPFLRVRLADALLLCGHPTRARRAAERGLALIPSTINRLFEPALLHVCAKVEAATSREPDAGLALLRHGIDVARTQGARSMELRLLTDLVKLAPTDAAAEARTALAAVYDGIVEGRHLADLREAQAVLAGAEAC